MATMAGIAERYRKVKDFGDWKEIENYIVAPNLGNTSSRAPREKAYKGSCTQGQSAQGG
ncbi:MAG: hypothetical protein L6V87_09850 [Ruminococcus sp.]|nr:MAG: hypothetical protein L6V87_09850 [Ruminococcus sp.]